MKRVRVATISYINSIPFVYGLTHADNNLRVDLLLHTPSKCIDAFINNDCDIAIVPVATLKTLKDYKVVSNYCISSSKDVRTVVLMSNSKYDEIEDIYLDNDSRTSAKLIKILCKEVWKINPRWHNFDASKHITETENSKNGYLFIGDKVFGYEGEFKYTYDLAGIWKEHTGLPFVFAVWIAKLDVEARDIELLNNSLEYGLKCIDQAITDNVTSISHSLAKEYLTKNIEYTLTEDKRKAIELFLKKYDSAEPSSEN